MIRAQLSTTFHDLESTASYVSRVAALYGAPDALVFASWFGARLTDLCDGTKRDVEKMAKVLQQDPEVLIERAVTGKSGVLHFRGMALPSHYVRRFVNRVCPGCVRNDVEKGRGQLDLRPYGRVTWMFNHHLVCPHHKRPLVKLPSLSWELVSDFRLRLTRALANAPELFEDVEPVEPAPIDYYLIGRLERVKKDSSWLDELPLPGVLRICEAIGGQNPRLPDLTDGDGLSNEKANEGFVRIGASEHDFKNELKHLMRENYPRHRFTASSAFGSVATELGVDLISADYAKVRAIMRDVAIEVLPVGYEKEVFAPGE